MAWLVFILSTFLEALDHAISSCLVPSYHLIPEHPFIRKKAFVTALRGPQESKPSCQLSKQALYPLHHCRSVALIVSNSCKIFKLSASCRLCKTYFIGLTTKQQDSNPRKTFITTFIWHHQWYFPKWPTKNLKMKILLKAVECF